ncbi:hypothetical protein M8J77_020278 [Diaphorina citri]|nr:hypothetical protein M8J77_020278 [Diaphorina citri]
MICESWANLSGVTFSTDPQKSVCMNFNRLRNSTTPSLYYAGQQLNFLSHTKFLGLQWDSKLKWNFHIEYVKKRALAALNMLKMVCNKKWGLGRATLMRFYCAYIIPIFDYGCMVYGSARKSLLDKLNPAHHAGIRIVTGALRTSPIPSLYVESCIPPLSIRRKKLMMNYVAKIAASPLNPVFKLMFDNNLLPDNFGSKPIPLTVRYKSVNEFHTALDQHIIAPFSPCIPPWSPETPKIDIHLSKYKKSDTPPSIYRSHYSDLIHSKYLNYTLCFTDGSKTPSATSCAFSIDGTVSSVSLSKINSIFSAELLALYLCLKEISEFHSFSRIAIISDSLSALSALGNICFSHPFISKIYQLWKLIVTRGTDVVFLWCPSHCGIDGNEAVDSAANHHTHPRHVNLCSTDDLKPWIKAIVKKDIVDMWNSIPPSNKLKRIKPTVDSWTSSFRNNRYEEVVLTRLRIGHTRVTHNHLFKKLPPPICQCGSVLTVVHILECPTLTPARISLSPQPNLGDDPDGIESLFTYLKRIDALKLI